MRNGTIAVSMELPVRIEELAAGFLSRSVHLQQVLFIVLPAVVFTLLLRRAIVSSWLRALLTALITTIIASVAALFLGYSDPLFVIGVVLIFIIAFVLSLVTSLVVHWLQGPGPSNRAG